MRSGAPGAILLAALAGPAPADGADAPRYHVAAHYYTWYSRTAHWDDAGGRKPRLGNYDSGDPAVAEQHVAWAKEYGIDSFSVEWFGPDSDGERNLDRGLLRAKNIGDVQWFAFYDMAIRFQRLAIGDAPHHFDFGDVRLADTFVADLEHLARRYFNHARYLRVGGRPVVLVYLARNIRGDAGPVVARARERLRALGHDVYLVGDSVWTWQKPDEKRDALFDALTAYQLYTRRLHDEGARTPVKMAEHAFAYFRLWEDWTRGFRARDGAKRRGPLPLWTYVTPQYDDRPARKDGPPVVNARSRDEVVAAFDVARAFADRPAASPAGEPRFVFVTSFNEWHEGTTVEPTADPPPGKAHLGGGPYGFELLEALRRVFKPVR